MKCGPLKVEDARADIIAELEGQMSVMLRYAKLKLDQSDWHGLSDAANDLRELSAELAVWKRLR